MKLLILVNEKTWVCKMRKIQFRRCQLSDLISYLLRILHVALPTHFTVMGHRATGKRRAAVDKHLPGKQWLFTACNMMKKCVLCSGNSSKSYFIIEWEKKTQMQRWNQVPRNRRVEIKITVLRFTLLIISNVHSKTASNMFGISAVMWFWWKRIGKINQVPRTL